MPEQYPINDCVIVNSRDLYQDCSGFLIGYTVIFRLALGHEQLNSLDEDPSGVWMVSSQTADLIGERSAEE